MTFTITDEQETIAFLKECSDAYYNSDETIIPDATFDDIWYQASLKWPDNEYFQKVGAPVRGAEIGHTTQIGGLEQVHAGELTKWLTRSEYSTEDLVGSEKLDGSSLTIKYVKGRLKSAYTRGDGITGKDVTRHVKRMTHCVPAKIQTIDAEIRGEFIIKKEHFETVKEILQRVNGKEYKNLRGIANGLINTKEIPEEVLPYIDFVAYSTDLDSFDKATTFKWLVQNRFFIPTYVTISHASLSEHSLNNLLHDLRETSLYEIDGIVVEYNEVIKRNALGVHASSCNPKFAFKWKTRSADNIAEATVLGVEWNLSRHKYWKPTVLLEPVELCGATIQRASGFNAKFIHDFKVGKGAKILITRGGDVIPDILEVVSPATEWDEPEGEWDWNETGVDAVSLEEDSIETDQLRMKFFFNTLEIDNVQAATIKKLYDDGNTNITWIIDLTRDEWVALVGKNGGKSYDSLHTKLSNIYLWELMAAWPYFGRGFGKRRAKALVDAFGTEAIFEVSVADINTVEGFQDKSAAAFKKGLPSFTEFFEWLLQEGFTTLKKCDIIEPIVGSLTDVKFVMTGFRDKDATAIIESKGGQVQDGIKDDTTYLVMKDMSKTSNKTKAAQAKGIKIISIDEMKELIA